MKRIDLDISSNQKDNTWDFSAQTGQESLTKL